MKIIIIMLFALILFFSSTSCSDLDDNHFGIDTSHLDYLYEEIEVNGTEMAFIHIYSNSPDYIYIDDLDEGSACVDDAARAAIFYLKNYNFTQDSQNLSKNKKLLEFIINLQAENGYFYNFIWKDHSINKDFKTSVSEPNWWSWRALWALTESYPYYKDSDVIFAEKIMKSIDKIISAIKKQIPQKYKTENFSGFETPAYLPSRYASDQASVLLLGLINYYNLNSDKIIYDYIKTLSQGIMQMQITEKDNIYSGAFLSWQNYWHAWGNIQSYSLLQVYNLTKHEALLNSALLEINNFYKYLVKSKFLNEFEVENNNGNVSLVSKKQFSQIAYGIRPMVYSCLAAYEITKDSSYAILAGQIGSWLLGNNPAHKIMYDKNTGRCYDGINSTNDINFNSGAESTIEALLTLLEIYNYDLARSTFRNFEAQE